jgi:hypothetical protein
MHVVRRLLPLVIILTTVVAALPSAAQASYKRINQIYIKHSAKSEYATIYARVEDGYGTRIKKVMLSSSNYIYAQGQMKEVAYQRAHFCNYDADPWAGCHTYALRFKVGRGHKGAPIDGYIKAWFSNGSNWDETKNFRLKK